jgi:hypothetical protein
MIEEVLKRCCKPAPQLTAERYSGLAAPHDLAQIPHFLQHVVSPESGVGTDDAHPRALECDSDEDHKDPRKDLTTPWHCSFSHVTCPPGFAAGAWVGNSAASRCHLQRKRRAKRNGPESTAPNH